MTKFGCNPSSGFRGEDFRRKVNRRRRRTPSDDNSSPGRRYHYISILPICSLQFLIYNTPIVPQIFKYRNKELTTSTEQIKKQRRSMNAKATSLFNNSDVTETQASIPTNVLLSPQTKLLKTSFSSVEILCRMYHHWNRIWWIRWRSDLQSVYIFEG